MKVDRFYSAIQGLHALVMAIDDRENEKVLHSIQKAKADFQQEIKSE